MMLKQLYMSMYVHIVELQVLAHNHGFCSVRAVPTVYRERYTYRDTWAPQETTVMDA